MEQIINILLDVNDNLEKSVEQGFRQELTTNDLNQKVDEVVHSLNQLNDLVEQLYLQINHTNDSLKAIEEQMHAKIKKK